MQILLSGQVGIDQTHLNGFAPVLVCVYTHTHKHTDRTRMTKSVYGCVSGCVSPSVCVAIDQSSALVCL